MCHGTQSSRIICCFIGFICHYRESKLSHLLADWVCIVFGSKHLSTWTQCADKKRINGVNQHWRFQQSKTRFVSEMTYTVSSGTLNSSIPYQRQGSPICCYFIHQSMSYYVHVNALPYEICNEADIQTLLLMQTCHQPCDSSEMWFLPQLKYIVMTNAMSLPLRWADWQRQASAMIP